MRIPMIAALVLLAGCVPAGHPILGTWKYRRCTVKNTSVRGTIRFRKNGTFRMDARARDDCPTPDIRGTYRFSLEGNRIRTDYPHGYGMARFFFIKGDYLYLSSAPITNVITKGDWNRPLCNWRMKLKRLSR